MFSVFIKECRGQILGFDVPPGRERGLGLFGRRPIQCGVGGRTILGLGGLCGTVADMVVALTTEAFDISLVATPFGVRGNSRRIVTLR